MTDRITTAEAQEALELAAKATEGPWTAKHDYLGDGIFSDGFRGKDGGARWAITRHLGNSPERAHRQMPLDADFIAAARELVPRLAADLIDARAEIERLEADVDRLRKRTHEIAEAADKRHAPMAKELGHCRSLLRGSMDYANPNFGVHMSRDGRYRPGGGGMSAYDQAQIALLVDAKNLAQRRTDEAWACLRELAMGEHCWCSETQGAPVVANHSELCLRIQAALSGLPEGSIVENWPAKDRARYEELFRAPPPASGGGT